MKKAVSVLLAIFMLLPTAVYALATDIGEIYYVDCANGDDANNGTSADSAWKSLEKASEKVYSAGDKILFKSGETFVGTFNAKGSGTAENPITISSYGGEEKPLFFSNENICLINIHNVNGWTVENLELSAPNGKGIWIIADGDFGFMKDFVVRNCSLHNIGYILYPEGSTGDKSLSPIYIKSNGEGNRIENVLLSGLDIYDCGYGIATDGTAIEWNRDYYVSPEVSYNQNFTFENITCNNFYYDAIVITSINNLHVNNCSLINTSLREDWYTAPMWSHHAKNMLIENCEIAGAENRLDGMALDFDGWTTDSTYQYIYSHDNVSFIRNCVYDETTSNRNCTVRYCLSVNDTNHNNKSIKNNTAVLLHTDAYGEMEYNKRMENFKFYNNTIINGATFDFFNLRNSFIANNIFYNDKDHIGLDQCFQFAKLSGNKDISLTRFLNFTGTFTNNCFYGCAIPTRDKHAVTADPLFAGNDLSDKNSFMLSSQSPLIGKGIKVEDDMGSTDFYGNPLTDSLNIGCYGGAGIETQHKDVSVSQQLENLFTRIAGYIKNIWFAVINYF